MEPPASEYGGQPVGLALHPLCCTPGKVRLDTAGYLAGDSASLVIV